MTSASRVQQLVTSAMYILVVLQLWGPTVLVSGVAEGTKRWDSKSNCCRAAELPSVSHDGTYIYGHCLTGVTKSNCV